MSISSGGGANRSPYAACERPGDVQPHVEPDDVGEFERAHRMPVARASSPCRCRRGSRRRPRPSGSPPDRAPRRAARWRSRACRVPRLGLCPAARRARRPPRWSASAVAGPTTISSSAIAHTGLKKCRPMKRSGCGQRLGELADRDARRVRPEQRRALGLGRGEQRVLEVEPLRHGLDEHRGRVGDVGDGRRAATDPRPGRRRGVVRGDQAPRRPARLPACARVASAAARARVDLDKFGGEAGGRRDVGDADAHRAGADDDESFVAHDSHSRFCLSDSRAPGAVGLRV